MGFVLFFGSDSPVEAVFNFFGAVFGTELESASTNQVSKLTF